MLARHSSRTTLIRRPTPKKVRNAIPRLEFLEERAVPATLTVTSGADPATPTPGTLRWAVNQANVDANVGQSDTIVFSGVDTVNLATQGTGQQIRLDLTGNGGGTITIDGTLSGGGSVTINANSLSRAFFINNGVAAQFTNLRLINGTNTGTLGGGALWNAGTAMFTNCSFQGNTSDGGPGGAITNVGTMTLTSCTLTNNGLSNSTTGGGAIRNGGTLTLTGCDVSHNSVSGSTGSSPRGGGIINDAMLTITGSTISGNSVNGNYAEGGGIASSGTLVVVDCSLQSNTVSGSFDGSPRGGGISSNSTLTIIGSTISGNSVSGGSAEGGGIASGGALVVEDCSLQSNTVSGSPGRSPRGGGISNYSASMSTITGSTILGNSVNGTYAEGGGITNSGTLVVKDSTLQSNSAYGTGSSPMEIDGGGISNHGALTLDGALLVGNSAYNGLLVDGGGIYNSGTLAVSNSTVTNNSAYSAKYLYGGGISNLNTMTLTSSTVTQNSIYSYTSVSGGGGITTTLITGNATKTVLVDSIVANNSATFGPDINGTVDSSGAANLVGNASGFSGMSNGTNGNLIGLSYSQVGVASVADNGGPTQTVALLPGSLAIGGGAAPTVLTASLGSSDTSVNLADATRLGLIPGTTVLLVDAERMLVTGISGNVLTVQRGYNGTAPAAHNSGAGVFPAFDQRGQPRLGAGIFDIGAFQAARITVSPTSGLITTEAGGTATFTVALNSPPTANVTISVSSSDTSEGTTSTSSLTFTPANWNIPQTVTVTGVDDNIVDGDIPYTIITGPTVSLDPKYSGLEVADVTATNADNDTSAIIIGDASVTEGNSGTTALNFAVTLSNPNTHAVTVHYSTADGTALAGSDYTSTNNLLTFLPGETSKTITVLVIGDASIEQDESFYLNLYSATNAVIPDSQAVGTILNDDPAVSLAIGGASVLEGTSGTTSALFTVSLSQPSSGTVTVDYSTADGTAFAPGDYVSTSGTLTFNPGVTSLSILVPVKGDTAKEPDETFLVNLSNPGGASIGVGQGVGTILDDDVKVTIAGVSRAEGDTGTSAFNFKVSLTAAVPFPVTVHYATLDGGALAVANDYVAASGTLTIPANTAFVFLPIQVVGDATNEANETFFVQLSSPTNAVINGTGRATGTISNDDPVPTLSIGDASTTEGNSGSKTLTFTVGLSAPSDQAVKVSYATADGTATAGSDYTAKSGTLTIPAGATSGTIVITVKGDLAVEADETFLVSLSGPVNAAIADGQGTGTILNDDFPPPTLSIGDVSTTEGNLGTRSFAFTVSLSGPYGAPVSVHYATADGTATAGSDYTAKSGTLTIPAGATSGTIVITVKGDLAVEADETFLVSLSGPVNAAIADGQGTGTILNDDGQLMLAAGTPVPPGSVRTVDDATLRPIVGAAIRRWQRAGLGAIGVAGLKRVTFQVADLAGGLLGEVTPGMSTVLIDRDAAGIGWYIDSTPARRDDFRDGHARGDAVGRVDLLTVVEHELGHILGLEHSDRPGDIMDDTLPAGVRRVVRPTDLTSAVDVSLEALVPVRAFLHAKAKGRHRH